MQSLFDFISLRLVCPNQDRKLVNERDSFTYLHRKKEEKEQTQHDECQIAVMKKSEFDDVMICRKSR